MDAKIWDNETRTEIIIGYDAKQGGWYWATYRAHLYLGFVGMDGGFVSADDAMLDAINNARRWFTHKRA